MVRIPEMWREDRSSNVYLVSQNKRCNKPLMCVVNGLGVESASDPGLEEPRPRRTKPRENLPLSTTFCSPL